MTSLKKMLIRAFCALIPFREKRKAIRNSLLTEKIKKMKTPESQFLSTYVDGANFTPYEDSPLQDYFINNTRGDISKWLHYFPIYERHFSRFRNLPVSILEIGVAKGGSLKMWKEYFGKDATIFGLDINPDAKKFENKEEGIHIIIGDQGNARFMAELMKDLPEIAIFIDDGGHTTNQQIITFLTCYDKIADDGVYVCEDLHTNYWPSFVNTTQTFIDFIISHIHALNAWFYENPGLAQWKDKTTGSKTKVPFFTSVTHGISFYNSMIVLEKEKVVSPYVETR